MNLHYDKMPIIGLNVIASGIMMQMVQNSNRNSILDFYIKEWLEDKEARDF